MNSRRLAWGLLAVGAAIMFATWYFQSQQGPGTPTANAQTTNPATSPATQPAATATTQPAATPPVPNATTRPITAPPATPGGPATTTVYVTERSDVPGDETFDTIGSKDKRTGYKMQVRISSRGAGVYTAKLSEYFMTVNDKMLWEKNPDKYEELARQNPDKYKGHYSLLNPVGFDGPRHLPFQVRRLWYKIEGAGAGYTRADTPLELWNVDWRKLSPAETASIHPPTKDAETLAYDCFIYRAAAGQPFADHHRILRLIRVYTVKKGSYDLGVELLIQNVDPLKRRISVCIDQHGPTGLPSEAVQGDQRRLATGKYIASDEQVKVSLMPNFQEIQKPDFWAEPFSGRSDDADPVVWMGQTNQFFGALMWLTPPADKAETSLTDADAKAKFYLEVAKESPYTRTQMVSVKVGLSGSGEAPAALLVPAGKPRRVSFQVFCGPKSRDLFQANPTYRKLNYQGTIDLTACCNMTFLIDPIARGMMWLLVRFSNFLGHNYGWGLILMVLVVRLLMHPLTRKTQTSMSKMQKLAPELKKIQEKYADDREALQRETMKLYKEAGASPFLGCLPMLIQMPIWMALYSSIQATVELRHAAWLPVWLTDLSSPDRLFNLPFTIPLVNVDSFNLLPILLAIAMYLQTKLNPQMAGQAAAATPEQQQQQKFMKVLFPFMMLFIFYDKPSGLTLYVMASMFASVLEQWIIRRSLQKKEATAAASTITVEAPGKAPRGKRPKKPKGPLQK